MPRLPLILLLLMPLSPCHMPLLFARFTLFHAPDARVPSAVFDAVDATHDIDAHRLMAQTAGVRDEVARHACYAVSCPASVLLPFSAMMVRCHATMLTALALR